ncbi:MAG: DUF1295 domain-containing protein [bacterium]|nr:DUF1295 domain-containing protein [bacterium]MDE0287386.1 DUF1295 domain-containing protein [bacterium]MDE0439652.1 DUF1295 domain-containing protein [bacterium]
MDRHPEFAVVEDDITPEAADESSLTGPMGAVLNGIAITGLVAAVLMVSGWLVSLRKRDVSIVDPMWPVVFVAAAWAMWIWGEGDHSTGRSALMLVMVSVWGVRLGAHLAARKWGAPEDYRYAAMRRRRRNFEWWSLVFVFLLQGALVTVVSLPVQAVLTGADARPLNWIDWAGVVVWGTGFAFEAISDGQLRRFLADRDNRTRVMDRGLWRYSRHPNYFGDCLVWWGIYLPALAAGAAWTLAGPVVMTVLLLRVSGVALLERTIGERRQGYADYARRTSSFIPKPPT